MILDTTLLILKETWFVLVAMSPYLLFGFLVSGLLSVLVSPETVENHLGGKGILPVIKAALFGVPLPLCSCGVIPVAAGLRRHGASRGATMAFLISTPETGVDSIMVTYSLLGPVIAVLRPVIALASGIVGGTVVWAATRENTPDGKSSVHCTDECCNPGAGSGGRIVRALRFAFSTLPRDIGKALLIGILVAGFISAIVPSNFFATYVPAGPLQILVLMAVGIPVYVCATASVPVAAALIVAGVSPGAALAFLITGPGTNAAAVATVWKTMGRRTAIIYVLTIAVTAFVAGVFVDQVFPNLANNIQTQIHQHKHAAGMVYFDWESGCAVALLLVLGVAIFRPTLGRLSGPVEGATGPATMIVTLSIEGMTCDHCVEAVEHALHHLPGVQSAEVDLKEKKAVVRGTDSMDAGALCKAVEDAGYKATIGQN